jgi:serine/threonine-protein kinase
VDANRAGTVVRQDPPAGAQAPLGSTVTVDVAQRPVDAVEVPALDGLTLDAAKARLAALGLRIGKVVEQPSRVAPGTIIGQDPPAGTVVASGTAVALTVAVDAGVVVVPDARGLSVQDATTLFDRAGLGLSVARTVAARERPGTVLDHDPPPGVKVAVGTTVSVLVAAPGIAVPSLVGLAQAPALATLARLNLVGSTHTVFSGEPAGTVVAQSPAAGMLVQAGDTVELSIARNLGGHVGPIDQPGPVLVPHPLGPR